MVTIEKTDTADQLLVSGVAPIIPGDKRRLAQLPYNSLKQRFERSKPCTLDLFDENSRAQLSFADLLKEV